jgi:hypothetical protein
MEVIEHVDPPRLTALEHNVFGSATPGTVIVTTPNVEYNARFGGLHPGGYRHSDHRFEWPRSEFRAWAEGIADEFGYTVLYRPVGDEYLELGPPTQMAVFTRADATPKEGEEA